MTKPKVQKRETNFRCPKGKRNQRQVKKQFGEVAPELSPNDARETTFAGILADCGQRTPKRAVYTTESPRQSTHERTQTLMCFESAQ